MAGCEWECWNGRVCSARKSGSEPASVLRPTSLPGQWRIFPGQSPEAARKGHLEAAPRETYHVPGVQRVPFSAT